MPHALAALLSLLPALSASAAEPSALDDPLALGERAPRLSFVDTRYLPRGLDEVAGERATAIVFRTRDCPLAQRYAARVVELEQEFAARGVSFLCLYVEPSITLVEVAAQQLADGAAFPYGVDVGAEVARRLGATRTPEVCVLDAEGVLRYRGRIDEQYRLGGVRPNRGAEPLRDALEALSRGSAVARGESVVEGCAIPFAAHERAPEPGPTWSNGMGELARRSCQECHRGGGEAPFPLLAARDFAERAETIAEVVREGRMPPWFADPAHGQFLNDRSLDAETRARFLDWLALGAPAGEGAGPAPLEARESRWRIAEPDLVLQAMSAVELPADGYVPYKYTLLVGRLLPYVFERDTWIEAIEIRPRNRRVLHHANLAYFQMGEDFSQGNFLTGQVPGGQPMILEPGVAVQVPAGSVLGLQMHYVTTGREEEDRIEVGLRFPREPVRQLLYHEQIKNSRFRIPPGAAAHPVSARRSLPRAAEGLGLFSHMHLRGRDMRFRARFPDGREETLLSIPNYSFDWQLAYVWEPGAARFPAGTEILVDAHFDNSPLNPYNPDPAAEVRFGPQTYHEMMYGFFFYTDPEEELFIEVDPTTGHALSPAQPLDD